MSIPEVIFVFSSNADAMIATKALKDAGVAAKMIPRPAGVDSTANLCLSIDGSVEAQAAAALSGAGIALGAIVK